MKILITGAAGFIGSALARSLTESPLTAQELGALAASAPAAQLSRGDFVGFEANPTEIEHAGSSREDLPTLPRNEVRRKPKHPREQADDELILLDHFDDGSTWANGKKRFFGTFANLAGCSGRIVQLDIASAEFAALLERERPELVYHFAACSDTTVYDEAAVLRTNLSSFYPLLEHSAATGARIVYASSASVYGAHEGLCRVGQDEAPLNPYAFSKLQMDRAAAGANAVGLRFFNVYGPGEEAKGATASMALQWARALSRGEELVMFEDSAQTMRDFVYIADVVGVCRRAAGASAGVYNVGSGAQASFADVASAVEAAMGVRARRRYVPNPYIGRYQHSTLAELDGDLVRAADMRGVADGCREYVRWLGL